LLSTIFCLNFLWIQLHFIIQMRKMFPISLSENVLLFASTLKFMVVQGCDCNKLAAITAVSTVLVFSPGVRLRFESRDPGLQSRGSRHEIPDSGSSVPCRPKWMPREPEVSQRKSVKGVKWERGSFPSNWFAGIFLSIQLGVDECAGLNRTKVN